jgi:uncharacterized protein (TIGR03437 family)
MRLLALTLLFAAPAAAQICTFSVSPALFNINSDSYTSFVTVTGGCGGFTATVPITVPWLHITSGPGGDNINNTVTFQADANPNATSRSGAMTIASIAVVVNQGGANCNFGLTPATQNYPVGGGTGTANVQASCAWQLNSNAGWIAFSGFGGGNAVGSSSGSQSYAVAPNACVAARGGTITLLTNLPKAPTLAITQDGSPSNLSLSASSATVSAIASDGRIAVTTGDECGWSATSDVSWLTIYPGSGGGVGNGGISYHVLANTSATRSGSIHVGASTYTVTQQSPAAPPVVLSSVNSAASYATDAVSPGEIVTLFGSGLGPATIVTLQVANGTVTNNLAGTQVLFDGVAAPLIYTLNGQVSAVVPYAVAGKSNTVVQVQYQGQNSNTITMPVQAAHPAIFSVDSSGLGPGAILNQDSSTNSSGIPAARGSVVQIFATGGGITNPASQDGAVTAGLFPLATVPTVTIDGVPAKVEFAGAAPGAVAGLTQINVDVPTSITPGIALAVVVKIGNFSSNSSVTIAVK